LTLTFIYLVVLLVATTSLVARFRRARGDERQQLKWVAVAAVVLGASAIVGARWLPLFLSSLLSAVTLAAFAAAVVDQTMEPTRASLWLRPRRHSTQPA
jgi:hypothetical protein